MTLGSTSRVLQSKRKTRLILAAITFSLLVASSFGLVPRIFGASYGLEDFPRPFVSADSSLNCSVVVTSSVGHGPCGGAHTMDVMGAIMVAAELGLKTSNGTLEATMDDYISSYNFDTANVEPTDVSSNLIIVGGPGVNQLTWYYNNMRNGTGARMLKVYFDKFPNGTDYICVSSTGHFYAIERDGLGRISADYGVVQLLQDVGGRFVMILAGLGGSSTWASCKIVSSYDTWNLHGSAAIVKYRDSNGDGFLDDLSIVEVVSERQSLSSLINPFAAGLLSIALLPELKTAAQKIAGRRWHLKKYLAFCTSVFILFAVISGVSLTVFSGDLTSNVYTFSDFSHPFVSSGGLMNCSVVLASSVGHGPCGSAHTMDVMGGVIVAAQLGHDATGGVLSSTLDDYISSYDSGRAQVSFLSLSTNLLVVGGPGVNQVTWYYNNLRGSNGSKMLPVYFDKYPNGTDCIYVASTDHSYAIERDGQGRVSADYGMIALYYDASQGVWVLIAAGLGGSGTIAASRSLANYRNWGLFGQAAIIKYADSNGDGYLDTVSIAESVGVGKSIDVYSDAGCTARVESIDWNTLSPGETKNFTFFVRNEGENGTTLTLYVHDWAPAEAPNYLMFDWNYSGAVVGPGMVAVVLLTLTVDSNINGVTNFQVSIDVNSD